MSDRPDDGGADQAADSDGDITRRRFVASGIAIGAAVVWSAPFPFADAAIGQTIPTSRAGGPTGPTGPSGDTTTTPAPPSNTQTAPPTITDQQVVSALRKVRRVRLTGRGVSFDQDFVQSGVGHWVVDISNWKRPLNANVAAKRLRRPVRIGAESRVIRKAGTTRVHVEFSARGRRLLKAHPEAKVVLRSVFVRPSGRRIPSNRLIRVSKPR